MKRDFEMEYRIARVVPVHTKNPFVLRIFTAVTEQLQLGEGPAVIRYLLGLVPLDCLDDISRADTYNPRKLKEPHRDELMDQIGSYGLIYPLVGTLEPPKEGAPQRLYLIDGRHRYNGLLELDEKLKFAIQNRAVEMLKKKETTSLSDRGRLREPRKSSLDNIRAYLPIREVIEEGKAGSPLVMVKLYLNQEDLERIGMAVFLNRGQKKLAGGEQIAKLARALELAMEEERATPAPGMGPSEVRAVESVLKTQSNADRSLVVLSRHVADVMEDDESPWFPMVGRWQGEVTESDIGVHRKPLTANNFLAFVAELVNDEPLKVEDERQRAREIHNLNRLGERLRTQFDWPRDIPNPDNPHTATGVLCRSFLIRALGASLNDKFASHGTKLLSTHPIDDDQWLGVYRAIERIQAELSDQAVKRRDFEELKAKLELVERDKPSDRKGLLHQVDEARGLLWSLDTILPSLKSRIDGLLEEKA